MMRRRWMCLGWWLGAGLVPLLGALAAAEPEPALRPLAMSGAALEAVDHALIRLAQGDTSAVEALAVSDFLDPVARADAQDSALARRWTTALPAALARLEAPARAHALTRLDARYRTLAAGRAGRERDRLASVFLPAPAAVADLAQAVDRAFDLGRFDDFLGMAHLLAAAGDQRAEDRRGEVALQLSGLGPQVDRALHLPPPGLPLPSAARGDPPRRHLAMRWHVVPGWVLACDPFDQVVWQYRVDRLAEVTTGPGAVLVHDSSGLRALAEDGGATALRPLPAGATVLAVSGGCAWFATGERAWRLGLQDGALQALALEAPPLGPPLVRGPQSLWLTARELLLFDQGQLVHRFQHGLPAATGWRLAADGERPLVCGGDGRQWRLESFADQLARLDGTARAGLLLRARRFDEALALVADPRDEAQRRLGLRAHLGLGPAHIAALGGAAQDWCHSGQDRALVALAAGAATAPDHAPLRALLVAPATVPALPALLDAIAAVEPAVALGDDAAALADDPAGWDHLCSGAAWLAWRHEPRPPARLPATGPLVAGEAQPLAAAARAALPGPAQRLGDGALAQGGRTYRLERGLDAIAVSCQAADGTLAWRQRWRPSSFLSAPSQTIDVRDGQVLVLEGGLRLNVFDAGLGVRLATFTVDDLGSGTAFVIDGSLAVVGPLGIDTGCTFTTPGGSTRSVTFPTPARWMVPLAGQLLVRGQDGVARLYPDGRVVPLPPALAQSTRAPLVTADGLVLGDQLWRWTN